MVNGGAKVPRALSRMSLVIGRLMLQALAELGLMWNWMQSFAAELFALASELYYSIMIPLRL